MSKQTDAAAEIDALIAKVAEMDGVLSEVVKNQESRDMVLLSHGQRIAKLEGNVPVPNPDPGPDPDDNAVVIASDNFESALQGFWSLQPSNASVPNTGIISNTHVYQGSDAFRLRLNKNDWTSDGSDGPSPRAQIVDFTHRIKQRRHYWFGWVEWIDTSWQEETYAIQGCQMWQVHGTGDINGPSMVNGFFGTNVSGTPGYFSLMSRTGQYGVAITDNYIASQPWTYLSKGQWVRHVVHVFMTYQNDGVVQYWVDDTLFGERLNAPNMWWGKDGAPQDVNDDMAFALMIYKPKFDNGQTSCTEHIKWVDKYRMAEGEYGYSIVDPATSV